MADACAHGESFLSFVEDERVRERPPLGGLSAEHLRHRSAIRRDGHGDRRGVRRFVAGVKGHLLGMSIDRLHRDQSNRLDTDACLRVRLAVALVDEIRTRCRVSASPGRAISTC